MYDMEEQYVSFETANMLKEAGFEADVSSRYIKEEPDDSVWCFLDLGIKRNDYNTFTYSITCPTQALAARWLREKHELHVSVDCEAHLQDSWFYMIDDFTDYIESPCIYSSYEEAMEAGLQRAIEIIKNRRDKL